MSTDSNNPYDTIDPANISNLYGNLITQNYDTTNSIQMLNIIGVNQNGAADVGLSILGTDNINMNYFGAVTSYNLPIKSTDVLTDMTNTPYTQNSTLGNAQQAWYNSSIGYAYFNDSSQKGQYVRELFSNGSTLSDESILNAPDTDPTDNVQNNKITTQETLIVNEGINNASYSPGFTAYNKIYLYSSTGNIYTITIDTGSSNNNNSISWTEIGGNNVTSRGQNLQTGIMNNKTILASGTITTTSSNYNTLNANDTYTNPIHSVVININSAVQSLINSLTANNNIDSGDTNVSDWALLGVSTGITTTQIGGSGGLFVESSNIYSNNTTTTNNNNSSIQQINLSSTDIATPQTIVTNVDTTNNINLNTNDNATLISAGNDTINVNNNQTLTATMHGTETIHTNTNNPSSTLVASVDSTANLTIQGKYSGIYLSPITNTNGISNLTTNTIFGLTGDGSASYMGNVNAVGYNASLNIDHNNSDTIDGIFDNLTLNNNTNETAYAKIDQEGYINTNNSANNINITANGAYIDLMGDKGNVNLWGENSNVLIMYGNASNHITGTWYDINGVVGANSTINSSISEANIYNDGGNITLTGTDSNGALTYNGTGVANIVGIFGAINATIGANQSLHASIGNQSYITVTSGGSADLWNRTGTINAINQDGGTLNVTMGSGYTGVTIDMAQESNTNITNFQGSNGQIVLNNLANNTLSINYNTTNNTTSITDAGTKGNIILSGTQHITTLAIPNDNNSLMLIYP